MCHPTTNEDFLSTTNAGVKGAHSPDPLRHPWPKEVEEGESTIDENGEHHWPSSWNVRIIDVSHRDESFIFSFSFSFCFIRLVPAKKSKPMTAHAPSRQAHPLQESAPVALSSEAPRLMRNGARTGSSEGKARQALSEPFDRALAPPKQLLLGELR